ncbi:pyridoxamine 5'-phosphate oxidase [Clostridia bacterium]|nr:pyridoxamine 5'-phosphate oxidase [Clostridia bacterium]
MQEVYEFLKKARVYYLATVDGDKARVRPFGTYSIFEGKLYFQSGASKPVSKQMIANPSVELCAFDGPSGTWLRIAAEAYADERLEAQEAVLNDHPQLKDRYAVGDGELQVFYLKNATATFEGFAGPIKTVTF